MMEEDPFNYGEIVASRSEEIEQGDRVWSSKNGYCYVVEALNTGYILQPARADRDVQTFDKASCVESISNEEWPGYEQKMEASY